MLAPLLLQRNGTVAFWSLELRAFAGIYRAKRSASRHGSPAATTAALKALIGPASLYRDPPPSWRSCMFASVLKVRLGRPGRCRELRRVVAINFEGIVGQLALQATDARRPRSLSDLVVAAQALSTHELRPL